MYKQKRKPKKREVGFPSPCGVRRVRDGNLEQNVEAILQVSVPLRGKEVAGLTIAVNSYIENGNVSVPLRGKEGAGPTKKYTDALKHSSFRPLAG